MLKYSKSSPILCLISLLSLLLTSFTFLKFSCIFS
uniref:Uncharacterized protein n=1 Tax=Rhizophora mucronata TaxID=61149 RepID=A0A2P2INC4_RHIMU